MFTHVIGTGTQQFFSRTSILVQIGYTTETLSTVCNFLCSILSIYG